MMDVKENFLKKFKSIKPMGYLKQETVSKVQALDGILGAFPKTLVRQLRTKTLMPSRQSEPKDSKGNAILLKEPEGIDVAKLMRDMEDDDEDMDEQFYDKENVQPSDRDGNERRKLEDCSGSNPVEESNLPFRRPDLKSSCLFDPNLLEAFQMAVQNHFKMNEETRQARIAHRALIEKDDDENRRKPEEEPPLKSRKVDDEESKVESDQGEVNPLSKFEERLPPGGTDAVVLYTTSLRGIRKTFEDCNSIRFLLESFKILFFERDVSMHMEFKEEVRRMMKGKICLPILFIRGRYIGGAEEVLRLHEQGEFKVLFNGISRDNSTGPCESCYGFRFVVCFCCNGSNKIINDEGSSTLCHSCNENGLIICPLCC